MINDFVEVFDFFGHSLVTFLSSEPIIYFVGGALLLLVVKIIKSFTS